MFSHIWFWSPVIFCKAVDRGDPATAKGTSISSHTTKKNTHLFKIRWNRPCCTSSLLSGTVLPLWKSPAYSLACTERACFFCCVAPGSWAYPHNFTWCSKQVIYCTLSPSLGSEIPEGEDCVSFISLLLTPCMVSGIELVFSDFDLRLIALNWNCKSGLPRVYSPIQKKDTVTNNCHQDRGNVGQY